MTEVRIDALGADRRVVSCLVSCPAFPLLPVCLGQHLARLEMLLAAIEFFRAFPKAHLPEETTDESMAFQNYFLVQPQSHRCVVNLW